MKDFSSEIIYKTSRSSGAGGQNVNKVETSVTAVWEIYKTKFFSEEELVRIAVKLRNKINTDGFLQMSSSEARSQLQNKKIVTEKLLETVEKALFIPKKRIKTKPTKASREKRLQFKKKNSEKKENRKFKF